jgi:hypothetical protein
MSHQNATYAKQIELILNTFPGRAAEWAEGVLLRAIPNAKELSEDELTAQIKIHFHTEESA